MAEDEPNFFDRLKDVWSGAEDDEEAAEPTGMSAQEESGNPITGLTDWVTDMVDDVGDAATKATTAAAEAISLSDVDEDGVSFGVERARGTDPMNRDTDGDGIDDGREIELAAKRRHEDPDRDGLSTAVERESGTDPYNADSDGDGASDGREVGAGSDPLDPNSFDEERREELLVEKRDALFEMRRGLRQERAETESDNPDSDVAGPDGSASGNPIAGLTDWVTDKIDDVTETAANATRAAAEAIAEAQPETDEPSNPITGVSDWLGEKLDDATEFGQAAAAFVGEAVSKADFDSDGLSTGKERELGTDPTDYDTDGDGISDGLEVAMGTDPGRTDSGGASEGASGGELGGLASALGGAAAAAAAGSMGAASAANPLAAATESAASSAQTPSSSGDAPSGDTQAHSGDAPTVAGFLDAARAQLGDKYDFGAEVSMNDADPDVFDCSELVEWAARRNGIAIKDGSWNQYKQLHGDGGELSVEDALETPGALVFKFSSDPFDTDGRPDRAHVAISLGNGKVLEATSAGRGVVRISERSDFTHAAVIPALADATSPDAGLGEEVAAKIIEDASLPPTPDSPGEPLSGTVPINDVEDADEEEVDAETSGAAEEAAVDEEETGKPVDSDGDGISDFLEDQLDTDASDSDSDFDGVDDGTEIIAQQGAMLGTALGMDRDGDGLLDAAELRQGTDPNNADTDGDSIPDLIEVRMGFDPTVADQTPVDVTQNPTGNLSDDVFVGAERTRIALGERWEAELAIDDDQAAAADSEAGESSTPESLPDENPLDQDVSGVFEATSDSALEDPVEPVEDPFSAIDAATDSLMIDTDFAAPIDPGPAVDDIADVGDGFDDASQ